MSKYLKKPVVVEAITFDEFVEYGIEHGGNVNNGMPWSFEYKGHLVTHEDDECYIISTREGPKKFFRHMFLVTDEHGRTFPFERSFFEDRYEPIVDGKHKALETISWAAPALNLLIMDGWDMNIAINSPAGNTNISCVISRNTTKDWRTAEIIQGNGLTINRAIQNAVDKAYKKETRRKE